MKKRLIIASFVFLAMLMILTINANATQNMLLVIEEGIVDSGNIDTISNIISAMGNEELNPTVLKVPNGVSICDAINETTYTASSFDSIIIQPTLSRLNNNSSDIVDAVSRLEQYAKKTEGEKSFITVATPWSTVTTEELADVKIKMSELPGINILDVSTNLLKLKEKNINVIQNEIITLSGDIAIAGSYLKIGYDNGKDTINNFTSYKSPVGQISDEEIKTIIDVINGETTQTSGQIASSTDIIEQETQEKQIDSTQNTITNETTQPEVIEKADASKAETNTKVESETENETEIEETGDSDTYTFRTDREPRISFSKKESEYLYLKLKDNDGILCEYTGGNNKNKRPRLYRYDKSSNKYVELGDNYIKRSSEKEYNDSINTEKAYIYKIGIPKNDIKNENTSFYVTASDTGKRKNFIREWFTIRKNSNEEFIIDRAPRSLPQTKKDKTNFISFLVKDGSGINSYTVASLPDKKSFNPNKPLNGGKEVKTWLGTIQEDWEIVRSVKNKKYVWNGNTKFYKVSSFFKNTGCEISGKKGVYQVYIVALDKNGMRSEKTMTIDTRQYSIDGEYQLTKNGKKLKKEKKSKKANKNNVKNNSNNKENAKNNSNSNDNNTPSVKSIAYASKLYKFKRGKNNTLPKLTVKYSDGKSKKLKKCDTCESNSPAVLSVTTKGKLTLKDSSFSGFVLVTATYKGKSDYCVVYVPEKATKAIAAKGKNEIKTDLYVNTIQYESKSYTYKRGERNFLPKITVGYSNRESEKLEKCDTCRSDKPYLLSVTESGEVKLIDDTFSGYIAITATYKGKKDYCVVRVPEKPRKTTKKNKNDNSSTKKSSLNTIQYTSHSYTYKRGQKNMLPKVKAGYTNGTHKVLEHCDTCSSSKPDKLSVTEFGEVRLTDDNFSGSVLIIAKYKGKEDNCVVIVPEKAKKKVNTTSKPSLNTIQFTSHSYTFKRGQSNSLPKVKAGYTNGTYKVLEHCDTCASSRPEQLGVSEYGALVLSDKNFSGYVTITAKYKGLVDYCVVRVPAKTTTKQSSSKDKEVKKKPTTNASSPSLNTIQFTSHSYTFKRGQSNSLPKVKAGYTNGTYKVLEHCDTCASSRPEQLGVSEYGALVLSDNNFSGYVTITAKYKGLIDRCTVYVPPKPTTQQSTSTQKKTTTQTKTTNKVQTSNSGNSSTSSKKTTTTESGKSTNDYVTTRMPGGGGVMKKETK